MEYRPLDNAKNEIRLLKIIPVDNDKATSRPGSDVADQPPDTIHCTLEHVSFDDYSEEYIEYSRASGNRASALRAFLTRNMQRFTDAGVWAEVKEDQNTQIPQLREYVMNESLASMSEWQRWNWGEYLALSYSWRTWENAQEIVVDGHKVKVTRNLYDFLLTIRRHMTTSYRWGFGIDALCINQGDIDERNEQLKRMTVIYQQAFSTILWIGCEADGSFLAMMMLEIIGQGNLRSAQGRIAT
jgi:hypothetical protein